MDVVYWDASAVLSLLFPDDYSQSAKACATREVENTMSSLALAEIYAALERARKSGAHSETVIAESKRRLERGRWRYLRMLPPRATLEDLASKYALKGAGLWHLALAKTLSQERPGLRLLSFDAKLVEAARGEGFSAT